MPEGRLAARPWVRVPVFHRKPRHLPKVLAVVGYDRRIQAQGVSGDESIERSDGTASTLELMPHPSVRKGCGFVKRRDMELQKEAQQLLALCLRHCAFDHHELQFRQHNGRQHQLAVAQSGHPASNRLEPLALVDDVGTGIGVEEITHTLQKSLLSRRRGWARLPNLIGPMSLSCAMIPR